VIVLGIESATELVGAAVSDGEGGGAEVTVAGRRRHAECLAPAIEQALALSGRQLREVEVLAVDLGPGLFTGLRVGVATAKGLAQGLGIEVVGVTSLEVLAAAALDAGWPGEVAAVVDGRRGEVFVARYRRGPGPGGLAELSPPARARPEDLAELAAPDGQATLACGDGALRYREALAGVAPVVVAGPTLAAPSPSVLADLALARRSAGCPAVGLEAVVPVYLRDADARINWTQREATGGG